MLNTLVYFVIYIVVVGCIIGLLMWLIDAIPVPEPFHRIARIAIIVIGVLIVIMLLLSLVGEGPGRLRFGEAPFLEYASRSATAIPVAATEYL